MEDFKSLTHVSPVLTNELLSKALSDWFKQDVTFTHWEYVGDTGKGDSYLSELIRIRIHGQSKDKDQSHNIQVILKNIPKNVCRRLTFRSEEFFKNEINFYEKVLPGLLKFQATKNISDPFTNYTKLFLTYTDGLNDVLCLEDASVHSFGSAVRQEGIDFDHCKVTYNALAKFHALSFAMRDQQPEEFAKLTDAIFETYCDPRLRNWYRKFWHTLCGVAIEAVEKEYPNSIYVQKVKEFAVPETYERMIRAVRDKTNGVLSHGDSWTNNFLYQYEDGCTKAAKIIDFQLARCASPVLDIMFFIYACTDQDLRTKHFDDLLKYYYEVLSKQIRDLGSDPDKVYSWECFMGEIKKYSFFGLAFSFESTPFIVLAPEDAVPMDREGDRKLNIDDFWQMHPFKTKPGRLREANNVVHCVDRGYI